MSLQNLAYLVKKKLTEKYNYHYRTADVHSVVLEYSTAIIGAKGQDYI